MADMDAIDIAMQAQDRKITIALERIGAHKTLDRILAEYLKEHNDKHPSDTTVIEVLEWHHKKMVTAVSDLTKTLGAMPPQ